MRFKLPSMSMFVKYMLGYSWFWIQNTKLRWVYRNEYGFHYLSLFSMGEYCQGWVFSGWVVSDLTNSIKFHWLLPLLLQDGHSSSKYHVFIQDFQRVDSRLVFAHARVCVCVCTCALTLEEKYPIIHPEQIFTHFFLASILSHAYALTNYWPWEWG